MWTPVSAVVWTTLYVACADKPETSCGESLCTCCPATDADDVPGVGNCINDTMTYIPWMPDSVWNLFFKNSNLSAVTLNDQFFSNVTQLKHLVFSSGSVRHIGPDVFSGFKHLTFLDISYTVGLTFDSVRNMLSIPGLCTFVALYCNMSVPPAHAFVNISSDVETLFLTTEIIKVYDMTAFCSVHTLRDIALIFGILTEVKTTCILQIEHLQLSFNDLFSLPTTCTDMSESFFPYLRTLNVTGNNIRFVGKACLPELDTLDLSNNKFRYVSQSNLNIEQFPNLKSLSIQSITSHMLMIIYDKAFSHPTLRRLKLDMCDMDFSNGVRISRKAFADLPRLTELSMNHNVFKDVDDARFLELFGCLNLSVLTLSHNELSTISWKTFAHFINLTRLELVASGLSNLPDGVFSSLRKLNWLDISDNKITTVTEKTFSEETRQQLRFLGLDKNLFTCSCDLMWFRNWYVSQQAHLFHKTTPGPKYKFKTVTKNQFTYFFLTDQINEKPPKLILKCNNIQGTKLADLIMADQACLLSQSVNVAIILVTSAMIVTLITVSLIFRCRWHIRLALYEVFRGRGDVRRMRLHANCFDYDVFVSYTKEDLPWVREHLMPELQDRLGLRLCVHQRDFIPGNNIVDNIVECVQSSRKSLMVFSKDFVYSQWCQFELTFCLSHVMDYDDTLLIVCLDDVTSRDMTPAMMAVLKTTTYIQWEDHGDAVDSFWGRLRLALREVTDMAVVTDRARAHGRVAVVEIAEVVDRNQSVDIAESTV
ncbi:toll-like receptor Tollo [Littorina saxatilis]|uniref:toll-like receptor Tollo n=1 Tax=Littorina saxatilis TaxID=31220 RepID=UPI0038B55A97